MVTLIILSLFLVGCSKEPTGYSTAPPVVEQQVEGLDAFAQCLTNKSAVMYGTEWCSHCKNQKQAFGDSFQYIDYVDCDKERQKCVDAGVRGFPTWKINGELYPGEQELYTLAGLTKCEVE